MLPRRKTLDTTPPSQAAPATVFNPYAATITNNPPPSTTNNGGDNDGSVSPSIMITVLILAIAVIIFASLYLLLRFFRRHQNHHSTTTTISSPSLHRNSRRVSPVEKNPLIDSLPLFTFDSLSSSAKLSGDCAVCLSKFEPKDSLRLLPICCHAFHAECIDTWLANNLSCPLCRSPIFQFDLNSLSSDSSRSFRVEIGNISRRAQPVSNSGEIRRSYSIGAAFDYVVDNDAVSELPTGSFRRSSEFKVEPPPPPPVEDRGSLAAEVGAARGGGGWLKDYLSQSLSSSRTSSFRGSGRWFFTGSGRRSTTTTATTTGNGTTAYGENLDLEASVFSEEIGELFRWLSGV